MHFEEYVDEVPDNCPDGYPVGLVLKNVGDKTRSFRFEGEEIHIVKIPDKDDILQLSYIWKKSKKRTFIDFTLYCEAASGLHTEQIWRHKIGCRSIKRIKPETV